MYTYYDDDAARHLFNVASGTDSMVVGEPQILGQVREAFRVATEEGTVRRMLHQLFQRALVVGKRARTETAIARHVVSLPQAGARVAADLAGGLEGKRVVVVGAGRMSELAARAVLDNGCTDIVIANRSVEKAESLGTELGGSGVGLDELPEVARSDADVLISATSSTGHVVERDARTCTHGSARSSSSTSRLPRDIDPAARDLPGVVLRDIEDLRSVVDAGSRARQGRAAEGEGDRGRSRRRRSARGSVRSRSAPAIESLRTGPSRSGPPRSSASRSASDLSAEDLRPRRRRRS